MGTSSKEEIRSTVPATRGFWLKGTVRAVDHAKALRILKRKHNATFHLLFHEIVWIGGVVFAGPINSSFEDCTLIIGTRWSSVAVFAGLFDFRIVFVGIEAVTGCLACVDDHLFVDPVFIPCIVATIYIKNGPICNRSFVLEMGEGDAQMVNVC